MKTKTVTLTFSCMLDAVTFWQQNHQEVVDSSTQSKSIYGGYTIRFHPATSIGSMKNFTIVEDDLYGDGTITFDTDSDVADIVDFIAYRIVKDTTGHSVRLTHIDGEDVTDVIDTIVDAIETTNNEN